MILLIGSNIGISLLVQRCIPNINCKTGTPKVKIINDTDTKMRKHFLLHGYL